MNPARASRAEAPVASGFGVKRRRSFAFHRNATFVALLAGYMGYYLCRQNFSLAYAPMKAALGMDKVTFGAIASFGTFVYAIGKIATGPLADEKGGRGVFFIGLLGSAVASLLFGLGGLWGGSLFFFALWGINRFFQSMGWGSLVNILAQWFSAREYGTAMGMMAVSYQFGGAVASLFAGALLALGSGWRGLFIIPAATLAVVGLAIWPLVLGSPAAAGYSLPADADEGLAPPTEQGGTPEPPSAASASSGAEGHGYLARLFRVLRNPMFLIMCGLSFILTIIRECFSLWMPAYFSDLGATASVAAFKSAIFPLLGCTGTLVAGWYSDKRLQGNRGPVIAVMLLGLLLTLIGLTFSDQLAQFTQQHLGPAFGRGTVGVTLVGLCGFFLFGPYSMVGGGVIALDFGGRATAATAAGLLDSAGYLAATMAGFGVAQLVTSRGWSFTFLSMAALTAVGLVLCLFVWSRSRTATDPAASPKAS